MNKCWKLELSAGYCGTDEVRYVKCSEEVLKENFDSMVCDHAEQYSYLAQLRTVEEIMTDEGCSEEEAQEIAEQEEEYFYNDACEHSYYEECSEEEWAENKGEEW